MTKFNFKLKFSCRNWQIWFEISFWLWNLRFSNWYRFIHIIYVFDSVRLVFPCKFCLYCICHSVTEQIVPIVQNELTVVKQMTECETAVLKKRIINKSSRCLFTFSINNLFSARFLLAIFNVSFFAKRKYEDTTELLRKENKNANR